MKKVTSLALVAGFLFLYMLTLRPGVLPADSGEFQLAASQLQIAHPPGFPLYILLGWLFTQLPGAAASNLNFLSALISSLTLGLMPWIIGELPVLKEDRREKIAAIGGGTAAILLGTSTTFWSQATTTNIRSLTTLFATVGLFYLLKWIRQNSQWSTVHGHLSPATSHRPLIAAVLFTSLGVTHHLSLAFVAIVMVVVVLLTDWRILVTPKLVGRLAFAVCIGLLPWLLLPILEPSLRNVGEFFVYVTGLGFGGDFFFVESAADFVLRMRVMWNVLTFQFHWLLIAMALLALSWICWFRWRMGMLLIGSFLSLTLIAATYRAPQTVEYMLPAYLPLVIGFGWLFATVSVGFNQLWNESSAFYFPWFKPLRVYQSILLILFFSACWQTLNRWPQTWDSYRWLALQHDTADYALGIFNGAPENAIVYAGWHWFTPLSYLQQVEGLRPDLEIVFVDPTFNNDWNTAIINTLVANRPVVTTNFDPDTFPSAPYLPLGEAFLWPVSTDTADDLVVDFELSDLTFGNRILVNHVDLPDQVTMSEAASMTIGWELLPLQSTRQNSSTDFKLFVHLVGSDGQIYAQQDLATSPQAHGLSLTRFEFTPRPGIPLGMAQLMLGAYLPDGTQLLDPQSEPRTVIGQVAVTGTRWRPMTLNPKNGARNESGFRLIGIDYGTDLGWQNEGATRRYEHWELENGLYWTSVQPVTNPANTGVYVPLGQGITWLGSGEQGEVVSNESISVRHLFAADRPILRDIGIAVRQVGYEPDNFTWAWLNSDPDNDIPATGAIPTLKWIAGSKVNHPRTLTIPEAAAVGQATEGFLRLYDVFTRRPVSILDERVTADGRPWIRYAFGSGVVIDLCEPAANEEC